MTKPNEPKHSPLPWKTVYAGNAVIVFDANDKEVSLASQIEFIVTACNAHYDLLEACQKALSQMVALNKGINCPICFDSGEISPWGSRHHVNCAITSCRKAIARATGKGE